MQLEIKKVGKNLYLNTLSLDAKGFTYNAAIPPYAPILFKLVLSKLNNGKYQNYNSLMDYLPLDTM